MRSTYPGRSLDLHVADLPGGYSFLAAFVAEVVMSMMFLIVIPESTDERAPKGLAPGATI